MVEKNSNGLDRLFLFEQAIPIKQLSPWIKMDDGSIRIGAGENGQTAFENVIAMI
jgi:hypothetical protein